MVCRFDMGFWVVLGGLLCGWLWVLVFCWVYGGGSWCFTGFVVVDQLFFVWIMALWVMLAGSNREEYRRLVGQNRE